MLLIGYHFPPDAAMGALRLVKFAKYLPDFGWEPLVLTVKEKYYRVKDGSHLADLENIRGIYRTRMLPHTTQIYLRLKSLFVRSAKGSTGGQIIQPAAGGKKRALFLRRIIWSLEHLPDDKQVWIPMATITGLRILRKTKARHILTSGPPMSCHVIGLLLKRLTGVQWIADFRDPWLSNPWRPLDVKTGLSEVVQGWLEKQTVLYANKIVTASVPIQKDFFKRYPFSERKTQVILNGYDPDDFEGWQRAVVRAGNGKFTLTYAGSVYGNRSAETFLAALSEAIYKGEIPPERIRVNFIGICPGIEDQVRLLGLTEVVRTCGYMDYRRCIEQLFLSDILLVFAQGQPMQIPGKIYDYIAVGKPMLIFAEDGATVDLAKAIGVETVLHPEDRTAIRGTVVDLYRAYERNGLKVETRDEAFGELSKKRLTAKLIEGID